MKQTRHLLQSSLIVIFLFALDKLVGLLRARLVSVTFGTGPAYDAFTAANQLPELFVTLIAGGALAAAFIPVYSAYLNSPTAEQSGRLVNSTLTLTLLLLGGVSAIGAIFAPWLAQVWLVPDFTPAQQQLTAEIMRIVLIQTTLFGLSGVLSAILYAHQHFILPALAPIALHLGYFVGLYLFVPSAGIHGLAWGTVVGGIIHIVIQLPGLWRYRVKYRPELDLQLAGVGEIVRLMGPRIITLGAVQLADLFIIRLTSGLPSGSTSAYFYAYYLQQLPETLFGTAIAMVVFPTLAELFNAGKIAEMKQTAMNTLQIIWMLTIPAGAMIALLGRPAITLFFQDGAFNDQSTTLVYSVLLFFSVRVVSEATLEIVARLFYAQHNTKTPMFAALGWLIITISLSYAFFDNLAIGGLALASTIGFTVQSITLLLLNRRKLGSLGERALLATFFRSLLATMGMSGIVWLTGRVISAPSIFLLVAVPAGGLTYLLLNLLLGGRELQTLQQLIKNRNTQTI